MEVVNKITINIDFKQSIRSQMPKFIQQDTNVIEFVVLDNGHDADMSDVGRIVANYKRPDKKVIMRLLGAVGNVITYELGADEMEISGVGELELQFYNADNTQRISTKRFKVHINDSMGIGAIHKKELTALQELFVEVKEVNDLMVQSEAVREGNETERVSAEIERTTAEELRLTNENTRSAAESEREQNELTRQTNETKRQNDTAAAISNAENATSSATTAAEFANVQGDYAKREADRLVNTDVSTLQAGLEETNAQLAQTEKDLEGRGVNVKTLGVIGDGVTDDTQAINDALALRIPIVFPVGRYKITDSIIFDNNANVHFEGGNIWNTNSDRNVTFIYDGVEALDKAMFMLSKSPIGTEPLNPISNVKFSGGCLLDGNNKIGYGFYGAYLTNESEIKGITVTNTLVDGIRIEKSWYASYRDLTARNNQGNGITIGKDYWGGVNGCLIENLRASSCGTRGDFTEANPEQSYGIGFYPGAGTTAFNLVAEGCYGSGIVYGLSNTAVSKIDTVYLEGNGVGAKTDGKTHRNWGMIVVGRSNNRASKVDSLYLKGAGSEANPQSIWLTGDRPAGTFEMSNVSFGKHLKAEWDNYRLNGHIHYEISQYIEGRLPRNSDIVYSSAITTLYVRPTGNDNSDGRAVETAFLTLAKAIEVAKDIKPVTTINVDGIIDVEELDLTGMDKTITFEGNGTASIINSTSSGKLQMKHASNLVEFKNFVKITRFYALNSPNIKFLNCPIMLNDSSAVVCFELINSTAFVENSHIDGLNSTSATTKSGVRLYNSTLRLKGSNILNFSAGFFVRVYEGSSVNDESYQVAYDNVQWGDGTGIIFAGNKIKNPLGTLTFV